jgi:hypothetical protein
MVVEGWWGMVWFRRVLQAVAWVLLLIIVPVGMATTWVREEIFDLDQYMASVDGLAAAPEVQEAIATRLATEVDAFVGDLEWEQFVGEVTGDPAVAEDLLAMNVDVATFIHDQTLNVVRLPQFQAAWLEINRQVHPLVERVLRGEESDTLQTDEGVIRLSLYPVYTLLVDNLTIDGIDLRQELNVGEDDLWLTLDFGDNLVTAQQAVQLLNDGSWALLVLGVVLAAVLIGTAHRRWLAGMWVGLALLIGGVVLWLALVLGGSSVADQMEDQISPDAMRVIIREVTASLQWWSWIAAGIGLALAVGCWWMDRRGQTSTPMTDLVAPSLVA